MSSEIKEDLKESVLAFIKDQDGFNADEVDEVIIYVSKYNTWSILYGNNIEVGIMGLGETPQEAFEEFITQWKSFNGFEWLKKSKALVSSAV